MTNEELRKEVKLLKALNDITYSELGEMMNLSKSTIYNWIDGQFDFGEKRSQELLELVTNLKGE